MPFCSTLRSARVFRSSSLTSRAASSSASSFIASVTFILRSLRRAPPRFWNMDWICEVSSSMPGGARISICGWTAATSISISLSSSSPSRSFLRNFCRVALSASLGLSGSPNSRAGGSSTSSTRSSAASWARAITLRVSCSRLCLMAVSTRSRMMVSTSRPDVADLGELGRLDLHEGRVGELGQPPRDLGLAHAGGADHQDVLRRDLLAQRIGHLLAPPAVAQRDGHRALGLASGRRCAC